ncbi:hypothetical protein [Streptomyces scabiei]|uniref:hypothetical protein n=1 Tax=Streptomyces scabiei TaxID=1930 RepID=UPI0029A25DC7|nr:hypothetical protein [Streptomyces scabiei]MDX3028107.1 hypothetical protein [Streptomyces scabiei]
MIIQYTPAEGGEPQHFDAGRMRASEIQIIERTADGSWPVIKDAMSKGDINAMRVVAWVIKKRSEPSLKFGAFDPWDDEMRIKLDVQETRAWAEQLFAEYGGTEDLADAFDELRDVALDGEACERAIADVTAPKEPAAPEPQPPAQPEPRPQPEPQQSPPSPSDS